MKEIQELKGAFERTRDIPYRLSISINEPNTSCVGKHQQLKEQLEKLGYQTRWVEVAFRWRDLPIPQEILSISHDDDTTHAYLEVLLEDKWETIDLTWDQTLSGILPVNEWDDLGNMKVAVPVLKRIPENEMWTTKEFSEQEMNDELDRNRDFFVAVNGWLEQNRKDLSK